jgi:hypothetical protein
VRILKRSKEMSAYGFSFPSGIDLHIIFDCVFSMHVLPTLYIYINPVDMHVSLFIVFRWMLYI